MDTRKITSAVVMAAFMAMNAATSKPGSADTEPLASASAPASAAPATTMTAAPPASTAATAAPEPDAPRPPNPDHSCDPKDDTTCEFHETCVPDGKKRANGTGKCTVSCPKGQAANPNGCSKKCASDADCARYRGPGSETGCDNCTKCKLLKQGAAAPYNPPRGLTCQQP